MNRKPDGMSGSYAYNAAGMSSMIDRMNMELLTLPTVREVQGRCSFGA